MPHEPTPDVSRDRLADELLVIRCQIGEIDAFDTLIARWHEPLRRYVRRMVGNDADTDDLTQEIWVRVIRAMPTLREGARLRGWLFGIARRALMDRLRHAYAAPATAAVDLATLIAEPEPFDGEADLQQLEVSLETLPVIEREVLTLFYLKDLSLAELADALAVPVGTVKSRLFRARRMLRAAIQEGQAE